MSQVCDTLDPNLKCAKFELEVISTNGDSQRLLKKQSKYKLPLRIHFQYKCDFKEKWSCSIQVSFQ